MEVACFTILWVSLALYALLAGADFGVGVWVLVSARVKGGERLRRDAFGYFGPVWEVNTLFLVFFIVGLITTFPRANGLLSRSLIGLVLVALVMFIVRSASYALLHHGPERVRSAATWAFAVSSVLAGAGLGYAAVAPASGFITRDGLDSGFYGSTVALAALPLTLAASAHLSALAIAAYAQVRGTTRPSSTAVPRSSPERSCCRARCCSRSHWPARSTTSATGSRAPASSRCWRAGSSSSRAPSRSGNAATRWPPCSRSPG